MKIIISDWKFWNKVGLEISNHLKWNIFERWPALYVDLRRELWGVYWYFWGMKHNYKKG